jgi:phosphatidylinositol alpha-mannosyltransferase
MRVGLVSPYPWDVPGGVVAHIRDLAEALQQAGHTASVLAPVDDDDYRGPDYLVRAGRSVPVPYNGSVSRLIFGPVSATRTHRWLRDGHFDVLHVHSPETFSLSLVALLSARGPIVATFHAAVPRSRILSLLQTPLQTQLEKIQGRIAVSPAARKTIVEHLGGDAVIIPNGVSVRRFAAAAPLPGWPGPGAALGFVGRIDEPRKGLPVALDAFRRLAAHRPGLRLLVVGPGDVQRVTARIPADVADRVVLLGQVSEEDKARAYASVDVFLAPHLGGESFGIVLLEAMAARAAIAASDLDAFRAVLDDGGAGLLCPVGDAGALAAAAGRLLDERQVRTRLVDAAWQRVQPYDWSVIAGAVAQVYETVAAPGVQVVPEPPGRVAVSRPSSG